MVDHIRNSEAISRCNTHVDLLDSGTTNAAAECWIFTTARPADADAAAGASLGTPAVTIPLNNPAYGAATDADPGATALLSVTPQPSANAAASGAAVWAALVDRDEGIRKIGDVSGPGGGGLVELSNTTLVSGAQVSITGGQYTEPESNA